MFRPRGSARNGRPWSRGKAAYCTQATPPPTIAAPMRGDPTHSATGPHQATPRAHASVRCPIYPCGSCAQRKEPCSSEHLLRACVSTYPRGTNAQRSSAAAQRAAVSPGRRPWLHHQASTHLSRAHAAAKRTDGASHAPGLVARCIADLRAPRPHPSDGGTVAGICGSARDERRAVSTTHEWLVSRA